MTSQTNKKQLISQIEQSLHDNDFQTFKILIEDEGQQFINELAAAITNEENKKKLDSYLQVWKEQNKARKEQTQNADKIRKINANIHKQQSESEQNLIEKEIKRKKQLKIEQKFGYEYYGNVRCLMIAYGDLKPNEEGIKIMHSQVQILFGIIVKFIEELQIGQREKQSNIKRYIENIFKEQSKAYYQITKQYKKATKSTKNQQDMDSQSSELGQFPSDDEDKPIDHMAANTLQQGQYFAKLTGKMNTKQYQFYSQCRSINFIQTTNNKKNQENILKFIEFLDEKKSLFKPNMKIYELLSFICCRFIRKIMFTIIKGRNEGKLQLINFPITEDQVRQIGNSLIQNYTNQLKQIKASEESIMDIAKRTFIQDIQNHNFKSLMPKKYSQSNKTAQQIWQESRLYRDMWIQRITAQKEIEEDLTALQNDEIDPKTQYTKYILKYLEHYKSKGNTFLWKKYFTQDKVQQEGKIDKKDSNGQPRKKVKLQSLKS